MNRGSDHFPTYERRIYITYQAMNHTVKDDCAHV